MLGKELKYGVADFGGQAERRRAGPAALHQREQGDPDDGLDLERGRGRAEQARAAREGALRAGISGSNDTTGKDCVRYGFRQNFYGETAATPIGPVLVKSLRQEQEGGVS